MCIKLVNSLVTLNHLKPKSTALRKKITYAFITSYPCELLNFWLLAYIILKIKSH